MNFYFLSSKSIDAYAYVNKFTHSISQCEYCESNHMTPSFPISYELTGKKIGDTAFMLGNRLFSDHFADILNDNLIDGFVRQKAYCSKWTDRKGNILNISEVSYCFLDVTSKCGDIMNIDGSTIPKCPKCNKPLFKTNDRYGVSFDMNKWDGSDIFVFDNLPNLPIVTEKLKNILVKNKLTNIKFEDISKAKF